MTAATTAPGSTRTEPLVRVGYDYVVVGSGAGGGPVAANLARAGHRVLLLEAGGASSSVNQQVPAFHPMASEEEAMSWRFFVRHYADQQQQQRDSKYCPVEDGVFYPRAGTLGGCTAHNAMILGYPHNDDWDAIARLTGDPSWSAPNMRRYFQRMERCRYRPIQRLLHALTRLNPSRHGFGGWLTTTEADPELLLEDRKLRRLVLKSAIAAFEETGGRLERLLLSLLTALDPNDWLLVRRNAVGVRQTPLTVADGRRTGTRQLLEAVAREHPDRLTIELDALATRVLFDEDNRAIGVEYRKGSHLYQADARYEPDRPDRPGRPWTLCQARAAREVILSGGTFNTPQLLQLSGIGPRALLERHGIAVRRDLPGVGENLQDRYEVSVVLRMKNPFRLLDDATMRPPQPGERPDPHFLAWERHGQGIYTTNGAVISVIKRSAPERPLPDLFLFGLVSDFRGYFPGYSRLVEDARSYFTWTILKAHTNNTAGRVQIRSADPTVPPSIDFHYFEEGNDASGEDLASVVSAVETVRSMIRGYERYIEAEETPGPTVDSREEIARWVRDEAWGHHASCTCKIGPASDPMAVLDSRFRVHGTKGLRVVDASVFPRIPGLFVVASVYMVAEKASDVILADARGARVLEP